MPAVTHTSLFLRTAPHHLVHQALFRALVLGLMVDSCGLMTARSLVGGLISTQAAYRQALAYRPFKQSEGFEFVLIFNPQLYEPLLELKEQFEV